MAKVLGFTIEIQGTKVAVDTTNQLREAMKKLQSEMGNVSDKELFEKMSKEASKLKAELKAVTDQQRNFVREIEAGKTGTGSYQQLNAELVKLRQNYKKLSEEERSSKVGQETIKNIQNLDKKLKDIDKSMGQFQRNVGNYPNTILSGIGGLAPSLSGITNTITDIGAAAGRTGKLIAGAFGVLGIIAATGSSLYAANAAVNETQADVRKTAGLTKKEVESLTDSLKTLTTKTSLDDLLKIGAALGQLGVSVNKDTIAAIDTLNVALGGELASSAEGVATSIGQLRNLFDDIQTGDIADDYLKIGNALNDLGAKGSATADVVADISARFSGTARALGVSTGEILGLSAAMQQATISAERAGSGIKLIFSEIAKNPEVIATKLNLPLKEFADLSKNNLTEAFIQVTKRLRDISSSGGDMLKVLDDIGIKGQAEQEVFLKLSKEIDKTRGIIDGATESLKTNGGILAENAIKQETLGATWDKMIKKMTDPAVNGGVTDFLKGIIFLTDNAVGGFGKLIDIMTLKGIRRARQSQDEVQAEWDAYQKKKDAEIAAQQAIIDAQKAANKFGGTGTGLVKETPEQKKEREAREKKQKDAALKTQSEYQSELLKLLSIYNELKIALIGDEYEREIAIVEKQYQDRIKAINDKAAIDGLDPSKSKQVALQKVTDELLTMELRNKGLEAIDKKKTDAAFKARQEEQQFWKNRELDEEKSTEDAIKNLTAINDKAAADKKEALTKEYEEYKKLSKDYQEYIKDEAEKAREAQIDATLQILSSIGSIAGEIGNFIDQLNQQQLDAMDEQIAKQTDKLDSLQEKMGETTGAARVELARQIENEKAALAKSNEQKAAAEKQAAKERQRIAIIQGVIDTASGILAATARGDVFGAIAAGIVGAIQIATISAQAFAQGGKVLSGERVNSNSGAKIRRSNGDNVLATVRTGEVVLNEQQQSRLGGARTFRRIGVPGFATGGYTGDPLPRPSSDYLAGVTGGAASNNELRSLISAIDARFDRLQVHVVGEDVANELNAQSKAKKAAVI